MVLPLVALELRVIRRGCGHLHVRAEEHGIPEGIHLRQVLRPVHASHVVEDGPEDVVRAVALPTGLVDNKVCAIDDVWSGLRLVVRVGNRGAPS